MERERTEPVPAAAVIDSVVEAATEPAAVKEQPTAIDSREEESPDTPPSSAVVVPAFNLEDMTSLELAVLITARYRTVRQALKAAGLLAARHEWQHLEECADILCRSYEFDEQLLGLHLVRRYKAVDPNMRPALVWVLRSVARHTDAKVAAAAQDVLDHMTLAD